jgi:hypothetical protein
MTCGPNSGKVSIDYYGAARFSHWHALVVDAQPPIRINLIQATEQLISREAPSDLSLDRRGTKRLKAFPEFSTANRKCSDGVKAWSQPCSLDHLLQDRLKTFHFLCPKNAGYPGVCKPEVEHPKFSCVKKTSQTAYYYTSAFL